MVKLSPPQQEQFMRAAPGTFVPASGAWGRQGCTMVQLQSVDEETLGEAMTLAWRETTARRPARTRTPGARATRKAVRRPRR
jgi:hypothetical protein